VVAAALHVLLQHCCFMTCLLSCVCPYSFWTLTANPDALGSKAVKAAAAARGCAPEQVGEGVGVGVQWK
jgi:hypothetical protein